jgi:predicted transport protein
VATEYVTGRVHGGRIDTLGLDDNNCPVIIEYKRALNENVISQGLYYLDWLMDHQGEFTLQVQRRLGPEWAEQIDWSGPRLLCIAGDFTRYDEYAVLQIPRNIELLRYRRYGGDLLLLELVRASTTVPNPRRVHVSETSKEKQPAAATAETGGEPNVLHDLWESLKAFLLALGDDVQMKELEQYVAFRRLKNFACVKPRSKDLQVWTRLDPSSVALEEGFTRDVSQLGHAGTGDLEIRIQTKADLERAQPLPGRAYQLA